MDWNRAIERNSEALRKIVAALFAMLAAAALAAPARPPLSLGDGASAAFTPPRHLHAAILLILRPAESAVRRLILIAARGLVLKQRASGLPPELLAPCPGAASSKTPAFGLIDPLKRFSPNDYDLNALPHVGFHSGISAEFQTRDQSPPDRPVNAAQLVSRLRALRHALSDLPRQARRLARWRARRDVLFMAGCPTRMSVFRPGLPPGWRQRPVHEVDDVLKECHGLALYADSA